MKNYKSARCGQNHAIHHSRAEARYCDHLAAMKKSAMIKDFRSQVRVELRVNDAHITNHIVDFEVTLNNRRVEYHEVKGWPSDVWVIKRRLCEALFPGIPYVVVRV